VAGPLFAAGKKGSISGKIGLQAGGDSTKTQLDKKGR